MDLYETLGVNRDADETAIRAAWKRAAKRAHPDQGGMREDFDRVQTALMVLTDMRRRERYDRTGEYDPADDPDNSLSEANKILAECIQAIIYDAQLPDNALANMDMLDRVCGTVADARRQLTDHIAANVRLRQRAKRLLGRFLKAGKPFPLIESMVRFQIRQMDEEDERAATKLGHITEVEATLAELEFKADEAPHSAVVAALSQRRAR